LQIMRRRFSAKEIVPKNDPKKSFLPA